MGKHGIPFKISSELKCLFFSVEGSWHHGECSAEGEGRSQKKKIIKSLEPKGGKSKWSTSA